MNTAEIEKYRKSGKIAKQAVEYAKQIVKPGMKLAEIADKIEEKILSLGGKLAFPINLSINEIAAHNTPSYDDEAIAEGLLKIDLGVSINGFISDTAFSLDLENSEENKKLIKASEQALDAALKIIKPGIKLKEIGNSIQTAITSFGFAPIRNLCGHELGKYTVHAGLTIPNVDNGSEIQLKEGAYAIEPFSTTGIGLVYDGKPSGIYKLEGIKAVRESLAREILAYIAEEKQTLPFSQREIVKKFSQRALYSLRLLEQQGIIKQYTHLIEKNKGKVAQSEHTILITDKVEIITN